jgi:hypothetical protein
MIEEKLPNLSNEELEWLAEKYLVLQNNSTYQKINQQFRDFINEYLEEELLMIKKIKGRNAKS